MAEANRYLNLLDELNSDDKPTAEPEPEQPKKEKSKAGATKKKQPTARVKSDPKMSRVARSNLAKSKNPDFEKGTYYLPKTTTHKMRIYAATEQVEMSDLVDLAVNEYLNSHALEND